MDIIKHDTWLSGVLDKKAFSLDQSAFLKMNTEGNLFESLRKEIEQFEFGFCKVPVDQIKDIRFVESLGFNLIDTNVQLHKNPIVSQELVSDKVEYTFACAEDASGAEEVANSSFVYSRFHLDDRVSQIKANDIKAAWVANYFKGLRGDHMIIARIDGKVVGFLQLLRKSNTLIIDLIAVSKQAQKLGIASNMIQYAVNNIDVDSLLVGTQLANVPSLNFYTKAGFKMMSAAYVFHYHKNDLENE